MKGLIGKKIGMTQYFEENGDFVPVTVIEAGPCPIVQKKTNESDGYTAVQLGFEDKKIRTKEVMKNGKKVKKQVAPTMPEHGHFKKAGVEPKKHIKEFRTNDVDGLEVATNLDVTVFEIGDKVDIVGVSKGRGYSGVMRRHNFAGNRASHGVKTHREPGGLSGSAYPSHVFKGKKLPGQYGNKRRTIKNLTVMKIDKENNLLVVRGAVPGPKNGIVYIKTTGVSV
jgi:large subunit ribosomal protein L3